MSERRLFCVVARQLGEKDSDGGGDFRKLVCGNRRTYRCGKLAMKIIDCGQSSKEWFSIRRGLPTASGFDRIITPVKAGPSAAQSGYMDELIAQVIDQTYSLEPSNKYISPAMQNGIDCEPAARAWYEFEFDTPVTRVGFCLSDCGRFGCSPDGLVGTDGIIEIKCPDLKTHIKYLREGTLPDEYKCQAHGELAVTGYPWLDFISYSPVPELDNFLIRIEPTAFTEKLRLEVIAFTERLAEAMAKLGLKYPELVKPEETDG